MRLAQAIAHRGCCSRRNAEKMIAEGRISVNGIIINTPVYNIKISDEIAVDGLVTHHKTEPRLWIYYKPKGVIVTACDTFGRKTIVESINNRIVGHFITVGRLDLDSEGLILLTDYPPIARYMELPRNKYRRVYDVLIKGDNIKLLTSFTKGVKIAGRMYKAVSVKIIKSKEDMHECRIILCEGKKREIRVVAAACHLKVLQLKRIAYGDFTLGNMRPDSLCEVRDKRLNTIMLQIKK